MPRADRLFALVQRLSGSRLVRLDELTRELETSARTIYRDLCNLEERGLPIERLDGAYRILPGATVRPLPLTEDERVLLTVALANPALDRHSAFGPTLERLRGKLAAAHALPPATGVSVAGPDRSGEVSREVAAAIAESIRARHSVSVLYTSLTGRQKRWRGIDPWVMTHRSEAWYVIGRCHTHDEARTFRLDRIAAVFPLDTDFVKPQSFDPDDWFAHSWGVAAGEPAREAVILFDETVAPLIEHARHHPTEAMQRLHDGNLEYRIQIGPLDELARWIAGFGGQARAIAPPALVERVATIAEGAAAAHRQTKRAAAALTRRISRPGNNE
jgi:predicted DNA-binding transcriptional regulator YafY